MRFPRTVGEAPTASQANRGHPGPATDAPGVLDALVAAGADCARLDRSHGRHASHRR